MSYKFDTLITILNKLDRREHVTAKSLTEEFEISDRSVYRYMETLLTAGFPINYDRKKGSYTFDKGFTLSKPSLSTGEILGLALGKKLLSKFGPGFENSFTRLEEKLNSRGPKTGHIVLANEELPEKIGRYLGILHTSIINFQRVEIVYKALSTNEVTTRKADPYYLFFEDGFWNLRAYCNLRKDLRVFALDKIISLRPLDEHFVPRPVSPNEELSGAFGAYVDGEPTQVILLFDKEIHASVLRKKWQQSEETRILKDGRLEMKFKVNGTVGIKWWLYRWIPFVEVISPVWLREEVKNDLKDSLEKHQK